MSHRAMFLLIIIGILALVDLYAWKGVSTALANTSLFLRRGVKWGYWITSIGLWVALVYMALNMQELRTGRNYPLFFGVMGLVVLSFLPKLVIVVFHLLEDISQLMRWVAHRNDASTGGEPISRIRFLSQIGLALAAIPFGSVLYGVTSGRRNFKVVREVVTNPRLPEAFDGLRIVQISDMHLGSFPLDGDIVQHGIDLINEEKPDLILFTGDLVNDYAAEAEPWLETLSQLQAPLGKYSILGNHDYSDYASWPSEIEKHQNLEQLKQHHKTTGFRLLLDEHVKVEKDGEHIELLGVQNWGVKFQQYGDLKKTIAGTDPSRFRLLMSHDPTHWEAQVQAEKIDLTVSGHTHGAQFGITIAGKTYSPAQWAYKQWAGMYEQDGMHLYVNRGFGFIGFPGRIGMPPEITVLELRRA